MKKIKLFIIILAIICIFSACSMKPHEFAGDDFSIVTTIFPIWDWTKNIVGDLADVTLLTQNGGDLHSYQPSVADIAKISSCDVFIYVGGESDAWVDEVLKNKTNDKMKIVKLIDCIDAIEEDHDGHEHEPEPDEHIWLSVKNAKKCVAALTAAVCEKDSYNADYYNENCASYSKLLDELDEKFDSISKAEGGINTIIFGDRFPFKYLANDYGIEYSAAFSGCSAESEASFETVAKLAAKIDETGSKMILVLENNDKKLAETIRSATKKPSNVEILTINSMQSGNIGNYLDIMDNNAEIIRKALQK